MTLRPWRIMVRMLVTIIIVVIILIVTNNNNYNKIIIVINKYRAQKGNSGHKVYIEGLGMTKLETNAFESGATIVMYAYRKAGDSSITILDQFYNDLIIGINELEQATNFKLLGNPIASTINIKLETVATHTLTLYNLSGQQLLQQQ